MNTRLATIALVTGWGMAGCAASNEEPPPEHEDLVDDLEDGDDAIHESNGRLGGWYTFHDMTAGTQTPPETGFVPSEGGAGGSAFAATTTGSGFTEWGAGMGFDLNNPAAVGQTGERGPYDASRYRGIAFQARGNVTARLALETTGVTPADRGGTCTPSETPGMECEDLHGTAIRLEADWKELQVPFSDLRQGGWGLAVPFAATDVTSVLFMAAQDLEFEISVDDVRFYE